MASVVARNSEGKPGLERVRDPLSVRLLAIGAVAVAAAAIVGAAAIPGLQSSFDASLGVWFAVAFCGGMASLSFGRGQPALSFDLPVLLACSFVCGPVPAAVVAFLATTDMAEFKGHLSMWRGLWNRAQVSVSVLVAGLVFVALGAPIGRWPQALVGASAALAADAIVNYAAVTVMLVLATRRPLAQVARSLTIGSPLSFALGYTAFGLTGVLIAEVYVAVGIAGVVAFAGPVLLAREAFRQTQAAHDASALLDAQREALRRVDQRIADERRDERNRLAEGLHDQVLQALYNVSLYAQVIRESYRNGRLLDLEKDVPSLVHNAQLAIETTRSFIGGLRQSRVGHAGLVDTLALLVARLSDDSGIRIVSEIDCVHDLPDRELLIYQVAHEALVNAIRHSEADTIWLSLREESRRIVLTVLDNGRGFELLGAREELHFGLALMEERAASGGGALTLSSSTGNGTRVEVSFPRN
jgi:signal transduction histidine kinase